MILLFAGVSEGSHQRGDAARRLQPALPRRKSVVSSVAIFALYSCPPRPRLRAVAALTLIASPLSTCADGTLYARHVFRALDIHGSGGVTFTVSSARRNIRRHHFFLLSMCLSVCARENRHHCVKGRRGKVTIDAYRRETVGCLVCYRCPPCFGGGEHPPTQRTNG